MRHRRALALLLAAGMLCSGCSTGAISSNYRPVEDLALIQTIGVDRAPEGVCLSAATGKACENEAPKRMTQSGVSMLAALDQLQDRTPSAELFYAQTSYLLLGEEAAAAGGLAPLLDFIARDPDMRLSAPLFIVRGGTAQQAVMETGDDKADVTEALAALEKDIALDGTSHACSCTDIARALAGSGCAVVGAVTCVRTPEDEGGKLALAPAGYAIFRDGDYVGSIEPETARGASMLLGVAGHGDLAVTDSDGEIRYDPENKPGVSNLLSIIAAMSGQEIDSVVSDLQGQGYGALKNRCTEVVLDTLLPIQAEHARLMADKGYLQSILDENAQRANHLAQKTLRKIQKKVGFAARG